MKLSKDKIDEAYLWALTHTCYLTESFGHESCTEEDWWALLRAIWKAELGLDQKKAQYIGKQWVGV